MANREIQIVAQPPGTDELTIADSEFSVLLDEKVEVKDCLEVDLAYNAEFLQEGLNRIDDHEQVAEAYPSYVEFLEDISTCEEQGPDAEAAEPALVDRLRLHTQGSQVICWACGGNIPEILFSVYDSELTSVDEQKADIVDYATAGEPGPNNRYEIIEQDQFTNQMGVQMQSIQYRRIFGMAIADYQHLVLFQSNDKVYALELYIDEGAPEFDELMQSFELIYNWVSVD